MKLFEKIKSILFDEEEVELPVIKKEEPREYTASKSKEVEPEPRKETRGIEEELNERELFESKQTFNFPAYLDEEKPKEKEEELRRTRNFNILDYERSKSKAKPNILKRTDHEEEPHKQFKPTPVISPVYGIVDPEYKRPDSSDRLEKTGRMVKANGPVNIEEVRHRAYGTLEDQIASTLESPVEDFYDSKEETESIEKLLINDLDEEEQETYDDIITAPRTRSNQDRLDLLDEIEEELDNVKPEEKKQIPVDDTIESDLFKLIDSMYENREDSEE